MLVQAKGFTDEALHQVATNGIADDLGGHGKPESGALPRVVYDRWKVLKVPAVCWEGPAYGTGLNGRFWGGGWVLGFCLEVKIVCW